MTATTPPLPGPGLDPLTVLATGANALPGVYALLLGSGVSTGAGVPTGWQVVKDLIRTAAGASQPGDLAAADRAAGDPEAWWAEYGDGQPLGYSNLLTELGTTPAARQALLAPHFEPSADDLEAGRKVPGAAHKAIAQLVARGTVRVVLTTNFDRLMEHALAELGIQPQVISAPEQVNGVTPLPHNGILIIKLHGDYANLEQRNTVEELSSYPIEYDRLLDRIFDEYGLLISGWSADWDMALVAAIERRSTRRYPVFWASFGPLSATAQRLVAHTQATVIPGIGADDLFTALLTRLEALDSLRSDPLTRDMAVTRLKKAIPNPLRRIELFDLINGEANEIVRYAQDPVNVPVFLGGQINPDDYGLRLDAMRSQSDTLLHLMATGVFHDDGTHIELWTHAIQTLTRARGRVDGVFSDQLDGYRNYPAHLALWVAGIAAISRGRGEVLAALLTTPKWRPWLTRTPIPAVHALHPWHVLDHELVNNMSRWNGNPFDHPLSHLVRGEVREPLRSLLPDERDYLEACDRFEAMAAVIAMVTPYYTWRLLPWMGEYLGPYRLDDQPRNVLEKWAIGDIDNLVYDAFRGDKEVAVKAAAEAVREIRTFIAS